MIDSALDLQLLDKATVLGIDNAIQSLTNKSRLNIPKEDFIEQRHYFEKNNDSSRGIIGISTIGCNYARKYFACTMCGHLKSGLWDDKITESKSFLLFNESLAHLKLLKPPTLGVYCSGSFFDEHEISINLRNTILNKLRTQDWLSAVTFESLPIFISEEKIKETTEIIKDVKITIGISLETASTFIRCHILQKKILDKKYSKAVAICNKHGINTTAYIVVKPPFLLETEAIYETAQSIHKAVTMGFHSISLEPISLQIGTLQHLLFQNGLYTLPTIWTIAHGILLWIQLYPEEKNRIKIELGGEIYTPLPIKTFDRCEKCSEQAKQMLKAHGLSINIPEKLSLESNETKCCGRKENSGRPVKLAELHDRIIKVSHQLTIDP